MHRKKNLLAVLAVCLGLAACSGADAPDEPESEPTTDTEEETPEPAEDAEEEPEEPTEPEEEAAADDEAGRASVTITGVDYGFEGFPEMVEAGTTLEFHNASDAEYHEMAVMRLADDEERSVEELLALPGDEATETMTFVGVAAAAPGEDGTVVDGELTLAEPGRYVATCFIPVGADPAVVEEAFSGAQTDGPPDMGGGAPHAMEGMVAEFVVE